MDKNDALKMFKEEIAKNVNPDTLEALKKAKSKKEALSMLEGVSIKLDDEMLSAVAGGMDEEEDGDWCIDDGCDGLYCPGFF